MKIGSGAPPKYVKELSESINLGRDLLLVKQQNTCKKNATVKSTTISR